MSLLSSYLAMPRAGHLEQAIHVFGYLKTHPKTKLAFTRRTLLSTRIVSGSVIGQSFTGTLEK
jgi:hypothetical protein